MCIKNTYFKCLKSYYRDSRVEVTHLFLELNTLEHRISHSELSFMTITGIIESLWESANVVITVLGPHSSKIKTIFFLTLFIKYLKNFRHHISFIHYLFDINCYYNYVWILIKLNIKLCIKNCIIIKKYLVS